MKISRRSDIDSEKLLQEVNLEEFFYGTNNQENDPVPDPEPAANHS
jgi:hypothetical protein